MNGFTTGDIGCERGNNAYNIVNRLENPVTREYLKTFEAIWSDKDKLGQLVTLQKFTAEDGLIDCFPREPFRPGIKPLDLFLGHRSSPPDILR